MEHEDVQDITTALLISEKKSKLETECFYALGLLAVHLGNF